MTFVASQWPVSHSFCSPPLVFDLYLVLFLRLYVISLVPGGAADTRQTLLRLYVDPGITVVRPP